MFFDGGGYSKGRVEPYPYYTHHRQKTCSNPLGVGRGQFGELFKSSGCLIFLLLFIFPCRRGRLGTIFRWRVARQVEEVAQVHIQILVARALHRGIELGNRQ